MARDESDLDGAGREFRAALRQAPDYLPAHLALAEVLLKSGQADAAAAEYQMILGRQPGQSQADFGLARIELQGGQDDAAVSRLEDLLAQHPEATGAAALLGGIMNRRGEAKRAAALAQWSRQRPEPAAPDPWAAALDADCCDCQRLELEAEQDLNSGELSAALPLLDRVAELDPPSWIPQLLRGWSAFQAGRFGEAVAEYRSALQRGGDPEMICPQVVNALLNQEKYDEAAAFIGGYRAGRPDSIPLLTAAAEVAVRRGDRAAARALLGQVLAREPYLYPQALQLVRLLWSEGRRAEAVPYLERLVEVRPLDVDAQGLLAQACLDRGAPAEAAAHLEPVLASANLPAAMRGPMEQMLAVACLEQGDALAAGGDAAGARRQWRRARSLAAGSGEIAAEAVRRLGPASP
jgi:predicted Zn-dependent protease